MEQIDLLSYEPPKSILGPRDGETFDAKKDTRRLNKQAQAVWNAMSDGRWYTIAELASKTGYPESSVGARTRDFRKPKYGCTRETMESIRLPGGLWRYRLWPEKRLK